VTSLVADCLYGVHARCAIRGQVAGSERDDGEDARRWADRDRIGPLESEQNGPRGPTSRNARTSNVEAMLRDQEDLSHCWRDGYQRTRRGRLIDWPGASLWASATTLTYKRGEFGPHLVPLLPPRLVVRILAQGEVVVVGADRSDCVASDGGETAFLTKEVH
jgi:hypothetical protein